MFCILLQRSYRKKKSALCDVITSSDIRVAIERPTSRHWRPGSGPGPGPGTGDGLSSKKTNLQRTIVVIQMDKGHQSLSNICSGSMGLQCLWFCPSSRDVPLRHQHHHTAERTVDERMFDRCSTISVISSRNLNWSVKQCLVSGGPGRR